MFTQNPKREIDIGTIGNASTGDILYDGGDKLNSNFNAVYNMFGDQRFFDNGTAEVNQTLHATGYYQKVTGFDLRTPLAMGTLWDIDTSNGAANPILSTGKPGECVVFVNSNGSCSPTRPIVIQPSGGSFAGVIGGLTITQPYARVECWCISNENNVPIWMYSLRSMFGSYEVPIEVTKPVTSTDSKIDIAHVTEYKTIKLLVTAMTADGLKMRSSEVNLMIDSRTKTVVSTEFAVMRIGNSDEDDEMVDIKYDISAGDTVQMTVKSQYPNMRIAVKSISTQRVGSA